MNWSPTRATTLASSAFLCAVFATLPLFSAKAQGDSTNTSGQSGCIITTAVPILTVAPDARSAALGDAGVAISADANAIHWNPGKLGFLEKDFGGSISYTPWLRKIINDMALSYVTGYTKLGKERGLAFSLLYFDLGEIKFTDENGNALQDFNPKEYTVSAAYGQKLSSHLSLGIGLRFIHSNLSGSISNSTAVSRPGNTAAGDLGMYYNRDLNLGATTGNLAFGAAITNLGAKISYNSTESADFIPTNLRVGTAFGYDLDPFNRITFTLDANKLLVPSPNRDCSMDTSDIVSAVFSSFSDAPGGGKEELQEINLSTGVEYWYNNIFAGRAGYFYENPKKGNRQYFTMGLGLRYQVFGFDVAYLIPSQQNNPLAETLRFTLSFNFERAKPEDSVVE